MVPCARPSTLPGTLVDTRTYSSPDFTKSVAVPPASALTLSTIVKSLFTLVEPKYKPGVVLSPDLSVPSALGAPNFAVSAFNIAMAFATFGSACAPGTRHERGRCDEATSGQETNKKALAIHVSELLYERRAFRNAQVTSSEYHSLRRA